MNNNFVKIEKFVQLKDVSGVALTDQMKQICELGSKYSASECNVNTKISVRNFYGDDYVMKIDIVFENGRRLIGFRFNEEGAFIGFEPHDEREELIDWDLLDEHVGFEQSLEVADKTLSAYCTYYRSLDELYNIQ